MPALSTRFHAGVASSTIRAIRVIGAAIGAAVLFAATRAEANGMFPASGQIVVDPGDAGHLVVRANFGILVSRDAGLHFDWICENGAGYGGGYDPGIAVTGDGTILAGLLTGLDVGHGDACTWGLVGGGLANAVVPDVSVVKTHPATAVALGSGSMGASVWISTDNAVTWSPAGAPLPSNFQGVTLDVAPSDPNRIYVSGSHKVGAAFNGALARSDDGGVTWQILDVAGIGSLTPYIAAIDPTDPGVVYARPSASPGSLLVTKDGGLTWTNIFKLKTGPLNAFALSPDGQTVLIGSPIIGVWRAPKSTLHFDYVSPFGATCLTWAGEKVYACSNTVAVGLSTDHGATFSTLLDLTCIRGPLACDPSTPVGSTCPAQWSALVTKLGITPVCEVDGGVPGDAGVDAGPQPDAGGSGGSAGSSTSTGAGTGGTTKPAPGPVSAGCGCRAGGADVGAGGALALASLAVLSWRRRYRRGPLR